MTTTLEHRGKVNKRTLRADILRLINNMPPGACVDERRDAVKGWQAFFIRSVISKKPYLATNENQYLAALISGKNLRPENICPQLTPCNDREDYDIYDYYRMWSSFPTQDRPGRRMKFLIRDAGHTGAPVMGICCLSSTVRQLKVRDQLIGWVDSNSYKIRAQNLAYIMDISTCLSVPPYSYLTSGKLLCYMMLSNEVRDLYSRRYAEKISMFRKRILRDIVMLITTGAFSENSPQYKGITLAGRKLFRFIGYTSGYSTFQVPVEMYDRIKLLLRSDKSRVPTVEGGASAKLRILRDAARRLGVEEERLVFSGHRRAIYAAPLAVNWREYLRGEDVPLEYYDYPLESLIDEWKSRWLARRLEKDCVMQKVRAFDPQQLKISTRL